MTNAELRDYSHSNGWEPSLEGLDGVFLKAWQGYDYDFIPPGEDHTTIEWYNHNVARARDAGLVVGHYLFLDGTEHGTEQVDKFLAVTGIHPDEIYALDWEWWTPRAPAGIAEAAANRLKERCPNSKRVLYTSAHFLEEIQTIPQAVLELDLWYVKLHGMPKEWNDWTFEQYSYVGNVDRDHFNGDKAALIAYAKGEEDMALTADEERALATMYGLGQAFHEAGEPDKFDASDGGNYLPMAKDAYAVGVKLMALTDGSGVEEHTHVPGGVA